MILCRCKLKEYILSWFYVGVKEYILSWFYVGVKEYILSWFYVGVKEYILSWFLLHGYLFLRMKKWQPNDKLDRN
jgi:hypothetical protein